MKFYQHLVNGLVTIRFISAAKRMGVSLSLPSFLANCKAAFSVENVLDAYMS